MGAGSAAAAGGGAKLIPLVDEEVKYGGGGMDFDQGDVCVYCMRVITDDEANKGDKGLIMVDNCFHMTHLTCFKRYCQKVLLTRQSNGDFCDAKCAKCQNVIDEANLRELLGA